MPLLMALCVVIGIVIGTFYANHFSGNRLNIISTGSNRLNNLLHIIDDQYVDNVDIDSLVDKAIPQILAELDPHSVYINAKNVQAANDDLRGSFSGVGIEFNIRQDTIHVQNVIKNGPAERAGILAGDKIVAIDGKPFVGKVVTNEEAMHRLKGPLPEARFRRKASLLSICSMPPQAISASKVSARPPIPNYSLPWQRSLNKVSAIL